MCQGKEKDFQHPIMAAEPHHSWQSGDGQGGRCQSCSLLSWGSGITTNTIYLAPILELRQLPSASVQDLLSDPFHIQQVRFLHGCPQDRSHTCTHPCAPRASPGSAFSSRQLPFHTTGMSSPRAATSLLLSVLAAPTLRQPFPLPQHAG